MNNKVLLWIQHILHIGDENEGTWSKTINLIKTSTNSPTNNNNFWFKHMQLIEANTVYGAVYILIKNMLMKIHNWN